MQQKAEVLELKQTPKPIDQKWLAHQKKEYKRYDDMEKKAMAIAMWNKGRILFGIQKKYLYNRQRGFLKMVKEEFGLKKATAYNYIYIYNGCPKPELLEYFPLELLRTIGTDNFDENLRKYIIDNRDRLRKHIEKAVLRELSARFKIDGFDPDDPELRKIVEEREKKARQYKYIRKNDDDLNEIERWWNGFDAVATAGLEPDDDGRTWLTEEQAKRSIVGKLKELGYPLEYELFVEAEVSNELETSND